VPPPSHAFRQHPSRSSLPSFPQCSSLLQHLPSLSMLPSSSPSVSAQERQGPCLCRCSPRNTE
jgi:hypothetical protein